MVRARVPHPTPIYRIIHIDNLDVYLRRGRMHAPNHTSDDGLVYRTIHDEEVQTGRREVSIHCGPGGTVHDYVPFYLGPRSPMLYRLHTGYRVSYNEGQAPLIYLVSTVQAVAASGCEFVFSDGHGLAVYTQWFDDLASLGEVDWGIVYSTQWNDTSEDPDRQRRKQAEFLVHESMAWDLVEQIGVLNRAMKKTVEAVLGRHPSSGQLLVQTKPSWYY